MVGGHVLYPLIPAAEDLKHFVEKVELWDDGTCVILCPWTTVMAAHQADLYWIQCEWEINVLDHWDFSGWLLAQYNPDILTDKVPLLLRK